MRDGKILETEKENGSFSFVRLLPGGKRCKTVIGFPAPGMVRVTHSLKNGMQPECPFVVLSSLRDMQALEEEDAFIITDGALSVSVLKKSGEIAFRNGAGETVLSLSSPELQEKPVVMYDYRDEEITFEESADGVRARTRVGTPRVDRMGLTGRQGICLDRDEAVYGLGSHEEGFGNLRGKCRGLYQHNMKACVPALVSVRGWELVFAMGGLMSWHDDETGTGMWVDCADTYDFYFLYKDGTYDGVMELYAQLTGHTPMPPASALGYIQSKERYKDAEEMISVVREYRRRNVPLDMIVLDWQSWPENQWGYKVFDRQRFPDPHGLTGQLHELGAEMMISIWPSMSGDRNENRTEMLQKGCMLPNQANYNAFLPEARALYWKQASEGLFRYGIDAWWCDCTEPFEADWHGNVKMEERERVQVNTDEARKYFDPTMLSAYSFWHSRGIWEGQRAETREKRVLNLTRSGYIGQHRYGTVVWSGDIAATWEVLARQVPEGMNYCATGEGGWTADTGAFFVAGRDPWFWHGDFDEGVNDPGYRELYTRWMQYSSCLPMMRSHGTDTPREIWCFGEKGSKYYDAIEKAIRFRYRLFPYLYSLLEQHHEKGRAFISFPALRYPNDPVLRDMKNEMMLGRDLLVRPVTEPMEFGSGGVKIERENTLVKVYLPKGETWYDWEKGEQYEGGQEICYDAPLDCLPLFVRGGTVLALSSVGRNTLDAAFGELEIVVYPGKDGSFCLYEDALKDYSYENGECARTEFFWNDKERSLTVGARIGQYEGMQPSRSATVHLISKEGCRVMLDGNRKKLQL